MLRIMLFLIILDCSANKGFVLFSYFPLFSSFLLDCCAVDDGNWGRSGRAVAVHVMSNSIEGLSAAGKVSGAGVVVHI